VEVKEIDDTERRRMLIEDFGMSEEIVSRLPADRPTPPPPGSATAQAQAL
jgi:N-hydroxyarylamine O-acetyltransferase